MPGSLSPTEEFVALFNNLKRAAGGNPARFRTFYKESKSIRDALESLLGFLARSDLERRAFNSKKIVVPRAPGFEAAWNEYAEGWQFRVWGYYGDVDLWIPLLPSDERGWQDVEIEQLDANPPRVPELAAPDPETEGFFDPLEHDGGAAIELGIEYLERDQKENRCSLALGAYDYLTETIGFDVHDVFLRWHKVPVVFMPAHVANRYGASDKGSLPHLLDDAVRAYVFGAPAAAIAMCRAALELVLKEHYLPDQRNNSNLSELIILADRRYDFVQATKVDPIRKKANGILHRYHEVNRLSEEDERTIVNYLKTVKFLIQRAPKR